MELTQEYLKQLLDYNSKTGVFTWKSKKHGRMKSGDIAGSLDTHGYRQIKINEKLYFAHRLAFLYLYGKFPIKQVDHIDGKRDNNKINNLREASREENCQNIAVYKNNTSGHVGVSWRKDSKQWAAYIQKNKRRIHLGLFANKEDAIQSYIDCKKKLHTFNPVLR